MTSSSIRLAALVVVSVVMGLFYAPVADFIARNINHLARVVGGGT
jgi:hypothetical protein